jgi:hypothetical protein
MGLWGSKQPRDLNINKSDSPGQIFVTENAISNVLKSVENNSNAAASINDTSSEKDKKAAVELSENRIAEYERNLVQGFNAASKEVEELFRERYKTVPICFDLQKSLNECYTLNSKQPLKCSDLSNEYIRCVEQERLNRYGLPAKNKL